MYDILCDDYTCHHLQHHLSVMRLYELKVGLRPEGGPFANRHCRVSAWATFTLKVMSYAKLDSLVNVDRNTV